AGPPDWIGAEVWGTGGDAGFTLDGSHAEAIAIPEAALARKPAALDHARAASVGVTFVVGWLGLADYAALQQGEDVAMWPPMETSQRQSGCIRAGMARMSSSMR
ncbi:MAG TPA: hypothetical protein VHY78_08505, partial [Stellaceae bacterium]|nr:hypothetical protein [Stellaceae bacterium]